MSNSNTCHQGGGGSMITKGFFGPFFFYCAIYLRLLFQRNHFRTVYNETRCYVTIKIMKNYVTVLLDRYNMMYPLVLSKYGTTIKCISIRIECISL